MVLDNTYSMTGAKIDALKRAASGLVDIVMANPASNSKIALVPFSQYVNVGMQNRNKAWLDVEDDYTQVETLNFCILDAWPIEGQTCIEEPATCQSIRDGVTVDYPCTDLYCDGVLIEPTTRCETKDYTIGYYWNGCVGSRPSPYDTHDDGFDIEKSPGLLRTFCPNAITPLTDQKNTIKTAIDAMAVEGISTYIPAGLVWGFHALTPTPPFDQGATFEAMDSTGGRKILILMSDGKNTTAALYPRHNAGSAKVAEADTVLQDTCKNVKAADIELYTIAFEVTDQGTRDLLRNCATDPGKFFDATDADQLRLAFDAIGSSLSELALVR